MGGTRWRLLYFDNPNVKFYIRYSNDGMVTWGDAQLIWTRDDSGQSRSFVQLIDLIPENYISWVAANNLDYTSSPDAGFADDPDHDGIRNGLEWVLGGNPLASDAQQFLHATTDATSLMLAFTRNHESVSTTATLLAEYGSDLDGWTAVTIGASSAGPDANGVTVSITENGVAPDTVVVRIPSSRAVSGRLFVRLKVTLP